MNIEYLQDLRNCAGRYVLAEHLTRGWALPQRLQEWGKRQFWWLHLPKMRLQQINQYKKDKFAGAVAGEQP